MKASKLSVCVACLMVAAFGCSSSSNESGQGPIPDTRTEDKKVNISASRVSPSRDIPKETAKVQEKGVELLVETPKRSVAGRAIVLKVSLSNQSKDDVFYGHISDYQDFTIQIQDEEDGKLVPRTKYGTIKLSDNEEERKKYIAVKLSPGGTLTHCYHLSHFFDLTIASTYNLSVSIKLNDGIRSKSPFVVEVRNIKLRVLEPYDDPDLVPLPLREDKGAMRP